MGRVSLRSLTVFGLALASVGAIGAGAADAQTASGSAYSLVGDSSLVHSGYRSGMGVELGSTGSSDFGLVSYSLPPAMTLDQLTNLSTEYRFPRGSSCWGGSPRFDVGVEDPSAGEVEIHFYIGPPPSYTGCATGTWSNSGNLASPTSLVDDSALGGGSAVPYSTVQARFGNDPVSSVELVVDGGWSAPQSAEFDDTQVNSDLFTYEK